MQRLKQNKHFRESLIYLFIFVLLLSTYLPYIPIKVEAATITPPNSTVDTKTLLTVSPSIDGIGEWYYEGLTTVRSSSGVLGSVRRYVSKDKSTKIYMVSGELGATWAKKIAQDGNYVFGKLQSEKYYYNFKPSSGKASFSQYNFLDLLDLSGYTYSISNNEITIQETPNPKVTNFRIKEEPTVKGCYKMYSPITVEFTIEEYIPTVDELRKIQVYGVWEGDTEAFHIGNVDSVNTSGGQFSGQFKLNVGRMGFDKLNIYISAYDGANRLDQDSKSKNIKINNNSAPFGKHIQICTDVEIKEDSQTIPMYDYTDSTLLNIDPLIQGYAGRQNQTMANHNGNIGWFGPVRYPTIYKGYPEDGGFRTDVNTTFTAEGRDKTEKNVLAYPFPFLYVIGPIDPTVAKPYTPVHNSIPTQTVNVQHKMYFSYDSISKMFNGNSQYVLEYTPTYEITTRANKPLGSYYYIRDLAEYSGGTASNNCTPYNDTCLEIYTTDYPDITEFQLHKDNDYTKVNNSILFEFSGFEYVSNRKDGTVRNDVKYTIEILKGPSQVGEKIEGTIKSNKSIKNTQKKYMDSFAGKYTNPSKVEFKPEKQGKYTVQLTIMDAVQRSTKSELIAFEIGPNGGPRDPDDVEDDEVEPPKNPNLPPTVQILGPDVVEVGQKFCLRADAYDPDGEIIQYDWHGFAGEYDGKGDPFPLTAQSQCDLYYEDVTEDDVLVEVMDDNGFTAEDEHTIKVVYPVPSADFSVNGFLTENRKVWLTPRKPYRGDTEITSAIRITKNIWKIEAVDSNNQSSIIVIEDDLNNSHFEEEIEVLFRKKGEYKITRYVENRQGLSDTVTQTITIEEDLIPTAKIESIEKTYLKENKPKTIQITSHSFSEDDIIGNYIFEVAYDSDNDGSFDDETYQTISKTNAHIVEYTVSKVGKYNVRLTAVESFNEPTYESHVDLSLNLDTTHRKYHQASITFEVDNMAPYVSLSAKEQPNVEIVFNMGDVKTYSKNKLETQVNGTLLPKLVSEGINPSVRVEEPVYYEDGHKRLGTIKRNYMKYDRDDGWEFLTDHNLNDDLFFTVDYYEQVINPLNVSGIPSGGVYDNKGNYYFTDREQDKWSGGIRRPGQNITDYSDPNFPDFAIHKYDAETNTVQRNFIPPEEVWNHIPVQKDRWHVYDYFGGEYETQIIDKRAGSALESVELKLFTTEENNLIAVYKLVNHFTKRYEHVFFKYSSSGELLDIGELVNTERKDREAAFTVTVVTEDFVVTEGPDSSADGENMLRFYKMSDILSRGVHSIGSGFEPFATVNESESLILEDFMVIDGKLMLLVTYYSKQRSGGTKVKQITISPSGSVDTWTFGHMDTIEYKLFDPDYGCNGCGGGYRTAVIKGFDNMFFTRDGKIIANVSMNYTISDNRPKGYATVLINRHKPNAWADVPIDWAIEGYSFVEPPLAYLPTSDIRYATDLYLKSTWNDNYGKFKVYSENPYALLNSKSANIPETPPDEIIQGGRNGYGYGYIPFSMIEGKRPIKRGDKKTLADTLAETEWESKTSKKFYVMLSNEDINDLPNENAEIASLLNQDDIHFISINTNSSKSIATQLMEGIEQKSLQITTTYTDTDVKNALNRIADFIIGVVFPQKDNIVDIHFAVENSQHSLTEIRNAIEHILKPRLNETGYDVLITSSGLVNKNVNGMSVRKFNVSKAQDYYILFTDNALTETNLNHIVGDFLLEDAQFIGVGNSTAKPQFEKAILKNMHRGTVFENPTDLTQSMEELTNYLIDDIRKRVVETNIYGLSSENKVLYQANYWDYENHPKYREKYETLHDPSVFENPQGQETFGTLNAPSVFTKVGLYQPTYQAQDDPLVSFSSTAKQQFANYRKWSNLAGDINIYIHRLPVPEFKVTVNVNTNYYSISNTAYDLDKQSINIGLGGGIAKQNFQWRLKGDYIWKDGLPPNPLQERVYEIKSEVMDFQKQKNYIIKEVAPFPLPPVAEFEPVPSTIEQGDRVDFINTSYEPTGQNMTAQWYYKKSTASNYIHFATGSYINGVGNANWNPSTNLLTEEGVYDIKLVVTDTDGLSDETVRQVFVEKKKNRPPKACMVVPSPNYIGDTITIENCSTDPDGDYLISEYVVTKPNGQQFTYSTGDTEVTTEGNLIIKANQHPVDIGTWKIKLTIYDKQNESDSVEGTMIVLDQIVQGNVAHTEQWLKNIQHYNEQFPSKAFNLNPENGLLEFFKGEKFMLSAKETKLATDIAVAIKEYPQFGIAKLREGANDVWYGSLFHEEMYYTFKDQEVLTFEFVAVFQNGWVARDEVKVKIRDENYWVQHTTY